MSAAGEINDLLHLWGEAHDSCWPVQLGVQVLLEVGLIWETSDALGALVVHPVIMLLEFRIAVE